MHPRIFYMREDIKSFLSNVQKPGRYTGGEPGSIFKNVNDIKLRVAFCFPDTYEIGMSNLGMRVLYGALNNVDKVWCERVYAPWPDMEDEMRTHDVPLFTHESGDAISEFGIIAFTMQYELCYSNILNMLNLGNVAIRRDDRKENDPIILAGGPCAYNPEPMADFVDIFSIGEGEESLPELASLYVEMKEDGSFTRDAFLYRVATELKGFYVPCFYDIEYNDDGTISAIRTNRENIPEKVTKRIVENVNNAYVPIDPVMPYIETVHDRVTLEVFRGCIRGCRFCQAGFANRPVREKTPDLLCDIAKETIHNSGYSEISLCSLSTSDYSKVDELTDKLIDWTNENKINLALPSLRADSFTKELMEKVSGVRTTTLTFAPEAGSQRLRDVINKNVTEEDILKACGVAFESGKSQVKLYFMDGLPGETYEDIEGIATLSKHVVDKYFSTPNRNKHQKVQVTLSVACFIPKPQTPFQWERQNTAEELAEKQAFLASKITDRAIKYNYHDADVSRIEAVFARGNRKLGKALYLAQQRGIKFDSWEEYFNYDAWLKVFEDSGVDPSFFANREMSDDEILPWEMIDAGVSKEFLIKERHKAKEAMTTPSCKDKCSGCGANKLANSEFCRWCPGHKEENHSYIINKEVKKVETLNTQPVKTIHLVFSKLDPAIYIGHLDLMRTMTRLLVMSGLPIYYSEGYNPIPRISFASPLSVGVAGEREILEFRLVEDVSIDVIKNKLEPLMTNGLKLLDCVEAKHKIKELKWAENEISFVLNSGCSIDVHEINEMFKSPIKILKKSKSGEKEVVLNEYIKDSKVVANLMDDKLNVRLFTDASNEHYMNPEYVANVILNNYKEKLEYYVINRKGLFLEDGITECI